ncbi:MAG: hypothetical protein NTV48_03365, partial [Candidatus Vogelbacteria bacterium]|nr:hypothetical protein [Candidatus Vogelbacteria bacterium]
LGGMWGNSVYVPVKSSGAGDQSASLSASLTTDYFNKPYYVRVRLVNADNSDYRVNGARVEAQSVQTFVVGPTAVSSQAKLNQLANAVEALQKLINSLR